MGQRAETRAADGAGEKWSGTCRGGSAGLIIYCLCTFAKKAGSHWVTAQAGADLGCWRGGTVVVASSLQLRPEGKTGSVSKVRLYQTPPPRPNPYP